VTDTGTSCSLSARLVAVTVTSSSWAVDAAGAASSAARARPAVAATIAAAIANAPLHAIEAYRDLIIPPLMSPSGMRGLDLKLHEQSGMARAFFVL
jgi:hypothetical protein